MLDLYAGPHYPQYNELLSVVGLLNKIIDEYVVIQPMDDEEGLDRFEHRKISMSSLLEHMRENVDSSEAE